MRPSLLAALQVSAARRFQLALPRVGSTHGRRVDDTDMPETPDPEPEQRRIRIDRSELSPEERVHEILRESMPAPRPPAARPGSDRGRYTFAFSFSGVDGAATAAELERYCRDGRIALPLDEEWNRTQSVLRGEATGARSALQQLHRWFASVAVDGDGDGVSPRPGAPTTRGSWPGRR